MTLSPDDLAAMGGQMSVQRKRIMSPRSRLVHVLIGYRMTRCGRSTRGPSMLGEEWTPTDAEPTCLTCIRAEMRTAHGAPSSSEQ